MADPAHLPFPLRTLSVGLRPVALDDWLEPVDPAELAAKGAVLDAHPESVAWLAGSEAAQAELAAILGASPPTIGGCARAVADDLCLLDGDTLVLVAGAVAHPNRWRLADKLGAHLLDVHEPVPGYPGRLGEQVERVLRSLSPGRALKRRSWALLDDPTLHQPEPTAGIPTTFDPSGLWLRVERQALRRLPISRAIVFAIRTRQWRLDELVNHPEQACSFAASVRATPGNLARYKGVSAIRDELLTWLDQASGSA